MTCKDCIHYKACENIAYEYAGEDAASAYDEDSCCKAFAGNCANFSDKSEWLHFPIKDCKTAYFPIGYGDSVQVVEKPISGFAIITNGLHCVIDQYGDLYEISAEVFLTKVEAQKEIEREKNSAGKD